MNREEIIGFFVLHAERMCTISNLVEYTKGVTENEIKLILMNKIYAYENNMDLLEAIKYYIFSFIGIGDFLLYTKKFTIDRAMAKRERRSKREIPYDIIVAVGDLRKFIESFLTTEEINKEALYTLYYIEYFGMVTNNKPHQLVETDIKYGCTF